MSDSTVSTVNTIDDRNARRVPESLQTVLIVANRGKEVNKPPPGKVASKLFGRRSGSALRGAAKEAKKERPKSALRRRGFGFFSRAKRREDSLLDRGSLHTIQTANNDDDASSLASANTKQDTRNKGTKGTSRKSSSIRSRGETPLRNSRNGRSEAAPIKTITVEDKPKSRPSKTTATMKANTRLHVSPQSYFESILKTRGYSAKTFPSLNTAYYNKPTPWQLASYGVKLIEAVRHNDLGQLREFMEAGLSPNACNEYGESIVHLTCRLGHEDCLRVLLEFGCKVQVVDDYGRTPMHDACWSAHLNPNTVDLLLEQDRRMLCIEDRRGATALTYLKESQWTVWTKFLMAKKAKHWPSRDMIKLGVEADPELTKQAPNSRPLHPTSQNKNADNGAIRVELAQMVSTGRMSPREAILIMDDDDDDDDDDSDDFDEEDSEMFDEDDSESSSDDDDFDFDFRLFNDAPRVGRNMTQNRARIQSMDESESSFDASEMDAVMDSFKVFVASRGSGAATASA